MIKTTELENYSKRITDDVSKRRISAAFSQIDSMAAAISAPWEIRSEIQQLRENYRLLRSYALDGVADPQREEMLHGIGAGLLRISAAMLRSSMIDESPKMYFSNVRFERLQADGNLSVLINRFREAENSLSMSMFSTGGDCDTRKDDAHNQLLQRLFNVIWTTFPLSSDDEDAVTGLLLDENVRVELREQLIGAVMLGALEYFDERRFTILARTYLKGEQGIELKALVLLLIGLWMQRNSLNGKKLRDVMATVRERTGWRDDLKMVFMNLVRTRDTDRITRTMRDELIPQMLKLRPEILKKFKENDAMEEFDPEGINPEWEELLEKSGVGEKLKELNALQTEGGDVMLGTFSGLKGFAFFHNVANWFAPFYTDQHDVAKILDETASDLVEIIGVAPMICDSDKYSMVFSLGEIPSANRRMMLDQFKVQSVNLAELRNSTLNPEKRDRNERANKYIHDLYRFFTLFRRKSEFKNPFGAPINLASVEVLSEDLADMDALEAVGEFYFKREYYQEAADVYNLLFEAKVADAQLYQKAGYCHQQLGNIEVALDFYRKSELSKPDSIWTLRRIAQCYKMLGNHETALAYYERVAKAKPTDTGVALNMGHCHLAMGHYDEALKCYFKVEYLDEKSGKALRPLAWCTFVTGDLDRSRRYYDKVLGDNPNSTDYLNAGHQRLASGDFRGATSLYAKFLSLNNGDVNKLTSALNADRNYLDAAGVDPVMIDLVADASMFPEI